MNDEWAEFSAEVARRFPRAVLEVWNEPNLAIFWRPAPDPERFATLQAIAYEAIKDVRPDIKVLAGGVAANQEPDSVIGAAASGDVPMREFLERAYAARPGLKGSMDALSFHPYPYGTELGAGSLFAKSFADVRAVAMANRDGDLRLWVTETGVSSGGGYLPVTEAEQADTTTRLYSRLVTMPDVDGVLLHRLLPPAGPADPSEPGFALVRSASPPFPPKPAMCALVALKDSTYSGCP